MTDTAPTVKTPTVPEGTLTSTNATVGKPSPGLAAHHAAVARLRDAHIEEWHTLMADEYAKHGLTYERPLTPEERAAAKAEATRQAALVKAREAIAALRAVDPDADLDALTP